MKKRLSILAVLVLAITVTAYSVSGTYAKYTSEATGTSSARVAKWSFTVGDANITTANNFTFDLFKTVLDNKTTDAEPAAETDVKAGESKNIIAPGTSGKFAMVLTNNSEVNAKYSIDYSVSNAAGIPVEFSLDGTNWKSNINDLDVADKDINMTNGTETVTVYWRWVYEADRDAADTDLGVAAVTGDQEITVSAKVTATQVD